MPGEQIPALFVWLQLERPESTGSNEIQAALRPNPAGGQRDKSGGEPQNRRSRMWWLQTSDYRAASHTSVLGPDQPGRNSPLAESPRREGRRCSPAPHACVGF